MDCFLGKPEEDKDGKSSQNDETVFQTCLNKDGSECNTSNSSRVISESVTSTIRRNLKRSSTDIPERKNRPPKSKRPSLDYNANTSLRSQRDSRAASNNRYVAAGRYPQGRLRLSAKKRKWNGSSAPRRERREISNRSSEFGRKYLNDKKRKRNRSFAPQRERREISNRSSEFGGKYLQGGFGQMQNNPMSYKVLTSLLEKPPNEVMFSIKLKFSGFKELLISDDLDNEKLLACLRLLSIAVRCDHKENLAEMLDMLLKDCQTFLNKKLLEYMFHIQNKGIETEKLSSIAFICDLIHQFQKSQPRASIIINQHLLLLIKGIVQPLDETERGKQLLGRIDELAGIQSNLSDRFSSVRGLKNTKAAPPNNFRDIPIFPDKNDLTSDLNPFLRANIVDGQYNDVEHYLDVQFRLIREDFVRPLREGISAYLKQAKSGQKEFNSQIRVYEDVKITRVKCTEDGIVHKVSFDNRRYRNDQLQTSNRLIYGSLVCFSKDNFETLYFGTISDSGPEDLSNGIVGIKFENPDEVQKVHHVRFTMVESEAYFEATRHVLAALQDIDDSNFPLKSYIVRAHKYLVKPDYLSKDSVYCFGNLVEHSMPLETEDTETSCSSSSSYISEIKEDSNVTTCEENGTDISFYTVLNKRQWFPEISNLNPSSPFADVKKDPKKTYCPCNNGDEMFLNDRPQPSSMDLGYLNWTPFQTEDTKTSPFIPYITDYSYPVALFNDSSWPSSMELGLNDFQYQAFKAALTQNVCLIQGPPGTGKTFVGLMIMKALLHNSSVWNGNETPRSPILIVCYTNHALDQFLEGVLTFTNSLVRVGGRSKSEKLEQYSLNHLKRKMRFNKEKNYTGRSYTDAKNEIRNILKNINQTERDLALCSKYVLSEAVLRKVMTTEHFNSFLKDSPFFLNLTHENVGEIMFHWLRLKNDNYSLERPPKELQEKETGCDDEDIIHHDYANNSLQYKLPLKEESQPIMGFHGVHPSNDDILQCPNIWKLNQNQRWRLYNYWLDQYKSELTNEIDHLRNELQKKLSSLIEIRTEEAAIIAKSTLVVGMTTTGAAKNRDLIKIIRSKIVIVEEAAEVLEAQIVTSLSQETQHLILIGDHQQLRPKPTVYELAKKFKLDVSLFERLIKNDFPYVKLQIQHRMRASISTLLVPHIYEELINHESVSLYDDIKGVTKNVFFLSHQVPEITENDQLHSPVNIHEAQFLVSLCRYLLQQGYEPSQITILTTYLGQLHAIKRLMTDSLESVGASVVDNFQGEENDIILLSLVRSNEEEKIGFLKTENRICVALSRAKKGLYCVGNFDLLSQKSSLWQKITTELSLTNSIGPSLELCCQIHKSTHYVSTACDFMAVPDGGCEQDCGFCLPCGHVCDRKCHILDSYHFDFRCQKLCDKITCELMHKCDKKCYEDCGSCYVKLMKTLPKCGHELETECHVDETSISCGEPCAVTRLECQHKCDRRCGEECGDCGTLVEVLGPCGHTVVIECRLIDDQISKERACRNPCDKSLPCGHGCDRRCNEECQPSKCSELIDETLPCGHVSKTNCHKSSDMFQLLSCCREQCQSMLACDHTCRGTCGQCFQGRLHLPCKQPCGKVLICGHVCEELCSSSCPPCMRPCESKCAHSRCRRKCGYPCVSCQEPCKMKCKHVSSSNICDTVCSISICNKPCFKILRCGHKCAGLCGETCICRKCTNQDITSKFFGSEDAKNARFFMLESCKHIFEITGLTQWLEVSCDTSSTEVKLPCCPKCKKVISGNSRFGNLIKIARLKVDIVKEKVFGVAAANGDRQNWLTFSIGDILGDLSIGSANWFQKDKYVKGMKFIMSKLPRNHILDQASLCVFQNYFNFLIALLKIEVSFNKAKPEIEDSKVLAHYGNARNYWIISTGMIFQAIQKSNHRTDQIFKDISLETTRLQFFANLYLGFAKIVVCGSDEKDECFQRIMKHLGACEPFDEELQSSVTSEIETLKILTGIVIGVSPGKKVKILKAMGLRQGQWYSCPNGHVYCITECGGAMVESICNECGAAIGGGSHTLRQDNRVASDMDGATHSAWSEGANMANYRLD